MNSQDAYVAMKSLLRKVGGAVYYAMDGHVRRHRGFVTILMYHRVLPEGIHGSGFLQPGMYVRESVFKSHVRFLKKNFEIISLKELLSIWHDQRWDQDKSYLVLSFDDGWLDNYLYAYPILEKYEVEATIFLTTSYVGTKKWFWPDKISFLISAMREDRKDKNMDRFRGAEKENTLRGKLISALRKNWHREKDTDLFDQLINDIKTHHEKEVEEEIRYIFNLLEMPEPDERVMLNWEEISEMSGRNMNFGSHACSHRILTNLTKEEARKEIGNSHRILMGKVGAIDYVPVFSYPNGDCTHELKSLVVEAGLRSCRRNKLRHGRRDPGRTFLSPENRGPQRYFPYRTASRVAYLRPGACWKMILQRERKIKILHVFSGDLWAGAEVMIYHLLFQLNRDPNFHIIALSLNEGVLTTKLRDAGIETHVIPEPLFSFPVIFWKSIRKFKSSGIDIIHSHRYKENLLAFLLAKSLGVTRTVTTVHGASEWRYERGTPMRRKAGRAIERWLLKKHFSDIIPVSNELREILVTELGRLDGIHVVYNGIGNMAEGRQREKYKREQLHIGTVGRMVPVKNFHLFLELACEIRKRAVNTRFSILGDGPMKEELIAAANRMGMQEFVTFLPPVPDPGDYYASIDIYVNTSSHEGIPLSILEAMSCGLPVVAFRVGGIPEIITHGKDGLLGIPMRLPDIVWHCMELIEKEGIEGAPRSKRVTTVKDPGSHRSGWRGILPVV